MHRDDGAAGWTTLTLAGGDVLAPEIGLALPVGEIYDSVAFGGAAASGLSPR